MTPRFVVAYALRDGNTYEVGRYTSLERAQAEYNYRPKRRGEVLCIWDSEDPERGDISDREPSEYEL